MKCEFISFLTLQNRNLDHKVGHRIRRACVEPSELLIHASSSVPDRRYEDLTFEKLASAHSAFTSAAVRIQCDARSLDRDRNRFRSCCLYDILVNTSHDLDRIDLFLFYPRDNRESD